MRLSLACFGLKVPVEFGWESGGGSYGRSRALRHGYMCLHLAAAAVQRLDVLLLRPRQGPCVEQEDCLSAALKAEKKGPHYIRLVG